MLGLVGIIPAYAGSTSRPRAAWRRAWDHPRVCGEHGHGRQVVRQRLGSSPRMRGARSFETHQVPRIGIIPAYAGSTRVRPHGRLRRGDHPRVCGEHNDYRQCLGTCQGSSPRMRGAQTPRSRRLGEGGIIPAYAGSTTHVLLNLSVSRDHPRVCGEHMHITIITNRDRGSSPRMRGAQRQQLQQPVLPGIIPAYAGSTTRYSSNEGPGQDHPRVCGEHSPDSTTASCAAGSSPRMRGARGRRVRIRFE